MCRQCDTDIRLRLAALILGTTVAAEHLKGAEAKAATDEGLKALGQIFQIADPNLSAGERDALTDDLTKIIEGLSVPALSQLHRAAHTAAQVADLAAVLAMDDLFRRSLRGVPAATTALTMAVLKDSDSAERVVDALGTALGETLGQVLKRARGESPLH